jgi:hypothetical protein
MMVKWGKKQGFFPTSDGRNLAGFGTGSAPFGDMGFAPAADDH